MTKPRLVKVRALFYVLQQVMKIGCAYFDTASFLFSNRPYLLPRDLDVSYLTMNMQVKLYVQKSVAKQTCYRVLPN